MYADFTLEQALVCVFECNFPKSNASISGKSYLPNRIHMYRNAT